MNFTRSTAKAQAPALLAHPKSGGAAAFGPLLAHLARRLGGIGAVLVLLALLGSLAACGGGDPEPDADVPTAPTRAGSR